MNAEFPLPDPHTSVAISFLKDMFRDRCDLAAIPPDGGRPEFRTFTPAEVLEGTRWIDDRQGIAGLYYHIAELRPDVRDRKATKADVARVLHLHADIDVADEATLQRIRSYVPAPTVIVFSGGGFQPTWALREPTTDFDRVERINMAIARDLGGDHCHNVDRLLRLPGTINMPNAKKRAAGRVPTLARIVSDMDLNRKYSLDDFPQGAGPEPAGPKGVVAQDPPVVSVDMDTLPLSVQPFTRTLIELGDDSERPRDKPGARFRSRSEAVFRVACDLARAGCPVHIIAGVLINPAFGIARSVLEKRKPIHYALRQARSALAAVSDGWPDCDNKGNLKVTMRNTVVALQRLGFTFSHDLFRYRKVVNGAMLDDYEGEISDDACALLRKFIIEAFNFDPKPENVRDAVTQLWNTHSTRSARCSTRSYGTAFHAWTAG